MDGELIPGERGTVKQGPHLTAEAVALGAEPSEGPLNPVVNPVTGRGTSQGMDQGCWLLTEMTSPVR